MGRAHRRDRSPPSRSVSRAAEAILREALACGVGHERFESMRPPQADSADVAAHDRIGGDQAAWMWCGDYSIDNGSGSVPSFLAAALHASQALGVIEVSFDRSTDASSQPVASTAVAARCSTCARPAVISVEGATARLRRASLTAMRTAATAPIDVVTPHDRRCERGAHRPSVSTTTRERWRARVATDALDRVRSFTATGAPRRRSHDVETLSPAAAATRIVRRASTDWGYSRTTL